MTVLTYSSYHAFKVCPHSYRLSYVDRVPRVGKPLTALGSAIHAHFAESVVGGAFMEDRFNDVGALLERVKFYLSKEGAEVGSAKGVAWLRSSAAVEKEARKLLLSLQERLVSEMLVRPFMRVEWQFGTYNEPLTLATGLRIAGSVDLLCGEAADKVLTLVDLKASRSTFHMDRDQLKFYQVAAEACGYNVGICSYMLFGAASKPVYLRFTKSHLQEAMASWGEAVRDISLGKFAPRPSPDKCAHCSVSSYCEHRSTGKVVVVDTEKLSCPPVVQAESELLC